jgi:hypothetical protein
VAEADVAAVVVLLVVVAVVGGGGGGGGEQLKNGSHTTLTLSSALKCDVAILLEQYCNTRALNQGCRNKPDSKTTPKPVRVHVYSPSTR